MPCWLLLPLRQSRAEGVAICHEASPLVWVGRYPFAFAHTCRSVIVFRLPPFILAFIARCASGDLLSC